MKKTLAALILVALACLASPSVAPPAHAAGNLFSGASIPSGDTCWETGADGWTVLCATAGTGTCNDAATGTQTGTCFITVSSSTGVNATCTAATTQAAAEAAPCLTLAKGVSLLRGGKPDWLLLKKGDTWTSEGFGVAPSGASASQPILISSYGTGARPLLKIDGSGGNIINVWFDDYYPSLAVVGLEFYNYQADPNNAAYDGDAAPMVPIALLFGSTYFLVEDCKLSFFRLAIQFSGAAGKHQDLRLRRSVISYQYSNNNPVFANSSGILVSGFASFRVEGNVFDHNGWNSQLITPTAVTITQASPAVVTWTSNKLPQSDSAANWITLASTGGGITAGVYFVCNNNGTTFNISTSSSCSGFVNTTSGLVSPQNATYVQPGPTVFNHNFYIGSIIDPGITFKDNIVAREGASGQLRSGGVATDNFSVANPSSFNFGSTSPSFTNIVSRNVFSGAVDTVAQGGYLQFASLDAYSHGNFAQGPALISENIFSMSVSIFGSGIFVGNAQNGWVVDSNIICAWPSPIAFGALGGGGVLTFTVLNQGSGYTDGTYGPAEAEIEMTGGTGSEWKTHITVSGGAITSIETAYGQTFNWRGGGYTANDMMTVNNALIGGTGSGFSARIDTITVNTLSNNHFKESACSAGGWDGTQPTLTDPTRTALTYDASLGGPGTLEHFLEMASANTKDNWVTAWTAPAINTYIRAGFGISPRRRRDTTRLGVRARTRPNRRSIRRGIAASRQFAGRDKQTRLGRSQHSATASRPWFRQDQQTA